MIYRTIAAAAISLIGFSVIAPAFAAPPTVIPSPGYERRLVESRRALGSHNFYANDYYGRHHYHEGQAVVAPRGHRRHERHGRYRYQR